MEQYLIDKPTFFPLTNLARNKSQQCLEQSFGSVRTSNQQAVADNVFAPRCGYSLALKLLGICALVDFIAGQNASGIHPLFILGSVKGSS